MSVDAHIRSAESKNVGFSETFSAHGCCVYSSRLESPAPDPAHPLSEPRPKIQQTQHETQQTSRPNRRAERTALHAKSSTAETGLRAEHVCLLQVAATAKERPAGMDEMEFTEAESNMNDLVSEYQQYQEPLCSPCFFGCSRQHVHSIPNPKS